MEQQQLEMILLEDCDDMTEQEHYLIYGDEIFGTEW